MLHVISVSWYAVVRWWCAGQGQFRTESRASGWRQVKCSNCSLSPNKYMDEWIPHRGGGVQRSERSSDSFWLDLWTAWLVPELEIDTQLLIPLLNLVLHRHVHHLLLTLILSQKIGLVRDYSWSQTIQNNKMNNAASLFTEITGSSVKKWFWSKP